jgi:hypothetical protein
MLIEVSQGGGSWFDHGLQAAIARELGVNRSTICRDLKRAFREWEVKACPTCSTPVDRQKWDRLREAGTVGSGLS